jgi:chorismate synthase
MTKDGFMSNHAGGILGGISSGQDIVVRIAVKPTPSIARIQQTRDIRGNVVEISVKGRHDPCIVPRIVPVAEALLALVLADCLLEQEKGRNKLIFCQ